MRATMAMWRTQKTEHRKCQFCKQERDCGHGPDPFLFNTFDEIEVVWLCSECFDLRKDGGHLADEEEYEDGHEYEYDGDDEDEDEEEEEEEEEALA